MQTLKPFLGNRHGDQPEDSTNRALLALLDGLSLHSFHCDEDQFEDFRQSLRKLSEEAALADSTSAFEVAESAVRLLQEYNAGVKRAVLNRQDELKDAIAMVSDALVGVGQLNEGLAGELRESQRQISRHSSDPAAGKARLAKCLENISGEIRHRNEDVLLSSQTYAEDDIDPVTSLPNSRKAVEAITAAWDHRYEYNIAVFAVRRLDTINMRYGFQAGDQVLRAMSEHLTELFAAQRLLFRWRGPYLVALVDRETEESRVARLASVRLQHTMVTQTREVLLSISIAWKQVPLAAQSIEEMIHKIDEITTIQLQKES